MDAVQIAAAAAAVGIGYLLGSIPFGWLIGRGVVGIDIRTAGSRNIGATNVARLVGFRWAVVTFLLDVGKGALPATGLPLLAHVVVGMEGSARLHVGLACGVAAILGHVFPLFLGFRGGKAVATSLGVMLGLIPVPTLIAFGVWIVLFALTRYVSLSSVVACAAFPVLHIVLTPEPWTARHLPVTIAAIALGVFVLVRHRTNIKRLLTGTESRMGKKPEPRSEEET